MEYLPPLDHHNLLSKKPSAVAVLFLNDEEKMLLVEPTYRTDWLLPGGSVEDNESPLEACHREIREELGLEINVERPLSINYIRHKDGRESYQMVFYGGQLSNEQVEAIVLPEDELKSYRYMTLEESCKCSSAGTQQRLPKALQALEEGNIIYFEDERD